MAYTFDRILFLLLRVGEVIFLAIVAGITGAWLHRNRSQSAWDHKRFIYTEVVAGLGLVFTLVFMFPFTHTILHYPMDLIMFALFMVAFGLLTAFIGPMHCGSVFNWHGITGASACSRMKADIAFCFLASMFFLATAIIGAYIFHRTAGARGSTTTTTTGKRRGWGRRRRNVV